MVNNGWSTIRVGDLVDAGKLVINDGYRVRNKELGPLGIPFVRGGDIGDGAIHTDVFDRISPEFEDKVTAKLTRPEDIAFITKGTVGRVGYLRPLQPMVVFAPQVSYWRVTDKQSLNPRFLYYLLRGHEFQANLHAVKTHGSMVADYVSLTDQRNFRLTIPPLEEQAKIAQILGSLDDKIDLNRRMNETLEATARAIFKSWFVDFDPVRAKIEGRQPVAMDDRTANLFPGSFASSNMGPIPHQWRVSILLEAVDIIGGGTPNTSIATYWNGDIPWFSVVDSPRDSDVFVVNTVKKITRAGIENSSTRLLPIGTTIITARGTVGNIALTGVPMAMNQSCYALVSKLPFGPNYMYFTTRNLVSSLRQRTHGSVFDTITRDTLSGLQVLKPPEEVLKAFESLVGLYLRRVRSSLHESLTLAALRDTLLPRLLSGEIRVKDAEKTVEAHT